MADFVENATNNCDFISIIDDRHNHRSVILLNGAV